MSEYWVSKKKYFCKYCDIYIADDAPSRQQHENGMRHKGNTERFIRGLYKGSEKRKKDAEEEKRDMARVEQAARAAFAQDVAFGLAKPTTDPITSTPAAPRKPTPKPSNPFANYSTAASLGYQDNDHYSTEAERRRTQGVVGDWELVAKSLAPSPAVDIDSFESEVDKRVKRAAETIMDEEDVRQFKLRKKTMTSEEIYDPGSIPIKLKKEEPVEPFPVVMPPPSLETRTKTSTPKWTTVQWKRPGETTQEEHREQAAIPLEPSIKTEEQTGYNDSRDHIPPPVAITEPTIEASTIKIEGFSPAPAETVSSSGSIFRKRKILVGGNRGRRIL
ncbi:hypothetical protein BDZ94DRAFT_1254931 [Collybia nuda]|uniref:Matrin-type domain-containing protein n=1 Tax=Collybia nuda TaxID=64659 RepID=A0A9P5YAR7_9AGAR|nr:hypothetical protein BDZ94DRAFT_1254931 [Collybia nuda]